MNISLGHHIRSLRQQQDLTLMRLSELTGISQASLSRVENGDVSPTADTLGRLASALTTPISQLLAPLEKQFTPHVKQNEQDVWHDPEHDFVRRNVSPPSTQLAIELIDVRLGPQQRISYGAPSVRGQEHHLYVLSGQVTLSVDGVSHTVREGDCLRYKLFTGSEFTTQESPVRYVLALA